MVELWISQKVALEGMAEGDIVVKSRVNIELESVSARLSIRIKCDLQQTQRKKTEKRERDQEHLVA